MKSQNARTAIERPFLDRLSTHHRAHQEGIGGVLAKPFFCQAN
jgi:hypothetical protein